MKATYNTKAELIKAINAENRLDEYTIDDKLTDFLLVRSLGDIAKIGQATQSSRTELVCTLIYNAIFGSVHNARKRMFNPDIGLMEEIIKRVDGAVPDSKERENFANIIGEALDSVLNMNKEQIKRIDFDEPCIIAFAKTIVAIAQDQTVGMNQSKRKERQTATRILLDRCGGKKNDPTSENTKVVEVSPSWEKKLN